MNRGILPFFDVADLATYRTPFSANMFSSTGTHVKQIKGVMHQWCESRLEITECNFCCLSQNSTFFQKLIIVLKPDFRG